MHAQRVKGNPQKPPTTPSTAVPSIEVYCLGAFQVRIGTKRVVRWPSLKARSLLGYLVAEHGRPLPKELLMEILWPGCEPALANNNLKAAVRALRQTLASIEDTDEPFLWILFQDGSYMINPDADIWCDVDQFEYHWSTAIKLEKHGRQPEAMREHETAEALYRGDYLEDNPYEDWTTLRREALKDTYLAILARLAEYAMIKAEHQSCIAYCQRILRKDPCREDAYQRLMVCYSRLGQRSRAIGWYRICEKTLKNELEVSPDRQTAQMYHRVMKGEEI
jgi:DNA-binding SARP family transcriptional activator